MRTKEKLHPAKYQDRERMFEFFTEFLVLFGFSMSTCHFVVNALQKLLYVGMVFISGVGEWTYGFTGNIKPRYREALQLHPMSQNQVTKCKRVSKADFQSTPYLQIRNLSRAKLAKHLALEKNISKTKGTKGYICIENLIHFLNIRAQENFDARNVSTGP